LRQAEPLKDKLCQAIERTQTGSIDMYRTSSGRMRFSFGRLMTNMFPNFANDSANDVDMSLDHQNSLFRWQLSQENPNVLNDLSFFVGGVTGMSDPFSPTLGPKYRKTSIVPCYSNPESPLKNPKPFLEKSILPSRKTASSIQPPAL
jgi:hypothetical protein